MLPTLRPGDRVLVLPLLRLRAGQLVAVKDPREPTRLLVKRVISAGALMVEVRGDNEMASTDSRSFGPLARSQVVGRVVYRYAPPERVGRL
jgi:nickel-type superoxide dismutase maturation protease